MVVSRTCLIVPRNTHKPSSHGVYVLLSVYTKSTVVEAPSASLDELMFDCLAFVMQGLQLREERLVVSSRHPVFVFCCSLLLLTAWLNLNVLGLASFCCCDDEVCSRTLHLQGPVWFCHDHPSLVPQKMCMLGKLFAECSSSPALK